MISSREIRRKSLEIRDRDPIARDYTQRDNADYREAGMVSGGRRQDDRRLISRYIATVRYSSTPSAAPSIPEEVTSTRGSDLRGRLA